MTIVPLSKGYEAMIDDEDADRVLAFVWSYGPGGYAIRMAQYADGTRRMVYLHRFVMRAKRGQKIDHANLNKLDCQKSNLRPATTAENNRNVGIRQHNTSGHTGVSFKRDKNRWRAYIVVDGKQIFGGYYDTEAQAVAARERLAKQHHGAFAR